MLFEFPRRSCPETALLALILANVLVDLLVRDKFGTELEGFSAIMADEGSIVGVAG